MSKIILTPFSNHNAEMVLGWRNHPKIRSNMIDDMEISIENHISFLAQLEEDDSRKYYVITVNEAPVGAIYFVGVGSEKITWGCYFGENVVIPGLFMALIFLAADISFKSFHAKGLYSEVAEYNEAPQKMNKFVGIPCTGKILVKKRSGCVSTFLQYSLSAQSWYELRGNVERKLPSSVKNLIFDYEIEELR